MLLTRLLDDEAARAADGTSDAQAPVYACGCPFCEAAGHQPQAGAQPEQFGVLPGQALTPASAPIGFAGAGAQALLSGSQWTGDAAAGKTVVTFSFANAGSQFSAEASQFAATLVEFSAADKAMTRVLLANIAAVCNVAFVEVPDNGAQSGQVRYAYSQAPNDMGYAGFAFFPSTPGTGGDVWIGKAQAGAQWDFYRPDLVLHETLHALGLKHPFEGGATLDSQADIIPNTVMSYSAMAGSSSGSLSNYPTQPMALDVAALQALYGASAHNTGDTAYNLADASFQSGFATVWDSAGIDTLDAGAIGHGVALDLREGGHSDIGVQVKANAYYGTDAARTLSTTVYTSTLTIAQDARVENANGSAFDDVLIGNDLGNALQAGAGNDLVYCGLGADVISAGAGDDIVYVSAGGKTIDGGAGFDKIVFAGAVSNYQVSQQSGAYVVTNLADHGSVSTLRNVERIEFSDMHLEAPAANSPVVQGAQYAEALRLYKAALNRLPDQEGLIFHTQTLQSGVALSQVAANFMASPEFTSRFGAPGNAEFVTLLYSNVLGRAPDASGLAYHTGLLDHSAASRADVLVGFSESPENQAATAVAIVGLGMSGMLLPV